MEVGTAYKWKEKWYETFQHILVGSADHKTSFIQTIWIDRCFLSSTDYIPYSANQGQTGKRADSFNYLADYMIFIRSENIGEPGFSNLDPLYIEEEHNLNEEDEINKHSQRSFATYYWFEFLLVNSNYDGFNLCSWVFLEYDENGEVLPPKEVFNKYFEPVN